jgi:uncharacterized repeat protein (TIGR03943 family)
MKSIESHRLLHKVALWTETAWLVLFGWLLVGYVGTGEINLFLSPAWNWLEMTAGLLGIALGAGAVLMGKKRRELYIEECCRSGGSADPVYRILGVLLMIGVLVAAVIVPGRSLTAGVQTSGDSMLGTYTPSGEGDSELISGKEAGERDFEEWLKVIAQDPEPEHHLGEEVNITGMVVVEEGLPEGEFLLVRYYITHCIACASQVAFLCLVVTGLDVPDTDDWVEVHGKFEVGKINGERKHLLVVDDYRIVDRPAEPYLFP